MIRTMRVAALCGGLVFASNCRQADERPADTVAGGDTLAMTPAPAPVTQDADDRAETALSTDSTVRRYGLDVDEDDNRLVIKGKVRTAAEKTKAEEVVRGLAAGATIENRIEVDANAEMNDNPIDVDDLEDSIEDAIEADSTFRGHEVDVDESNGRIVLSGEASAAARTSAEQLAKRLAGTVEVVNRITVH